MWYDFFVCTEDLLPCSLAGTLRTLSHLLQARWGPCQSFFNQNWDLVKLSPSKMGTLLSPNQAPWRSYQALSASQSEGAQPALNKEDSWSALVRQPENHTATLAQSPPSPILSLLKI